MAISRSNNPFHARDERRAANAERGSADSPLFTRSPADLAFGIQAKANESRGADILRASWGIEYIDRVLHRIHGTRFVVWLARPSHMKTTGSSYLVRRMGRMVAARAAAAGVDLADWPEYVLFLSKEEEAEDVALSIVGSDIRVGDVVPDYDGQTKATPDQLTEAGWQVLDWPIWIQADGPRPLRGRLGNFTLTPEAIWEDICRVFDATGKFPVMVVADYLQIMQTDGPSQEENTRRTAHGMRNLAKALGCPVIALSQAGRQVDARPIPIPEVGDSQWSSAAEQSADVVIATTFPARWPVRVLEKLEGKFQPQPMSDPSVVLDIDDNLVILDILKQRGAQGHGRFPMSVDHDTGTFGPVGWTPTERPA